MKYYFVPDFSKFGISSSQMHACRYVSLLVLDGVSLATLGASMDKDANLKADAWWVDICDTFIALLAGFVYLTVVGQEVRCLPDHRLCLSQ